MPRFLARHERLSVALVSLVCTWLFFFEYFPPFRRVHFPFDIEGFHYPLWNYAFHALRAGRFPLWDPSMYCGSPFAANIQAALFYPPSWLLFAVNAGHRLIAYVWVEALVAAHLWLAFFLAWLWLRRRFSFLASVLAAAVYGFSGCMLYQIQHAGMIMGYAWAPLALLGIDEANDTGSWRPFWKVAAASALCLLAGYPSTWVVLCCSGAAYAAASLRPRVFLGAVCALGASLLLAAVQILPTAEANPLKVFDPKYGGGIKSLEYYAALFIPNYFKLGGRPYGWGSPPGTYLYLGAPAFCLARARRLRPYLPVLAIGVVCAIFLVDPLGLTDELLRKSALAYQVVRSVNFLEQVPLMATILAAIGIEGYLKAPPLPISRRSLTVGLLLLLLWLARQIYVGLPGGPDFASHWRGAIEAAITLALFAFLLRAWRAAGSRSRAWLAFALLFLVWNDYRVYGTGRGFNSSPGRAGEDYSGQCFPGVSVEACRALHADPAYRLAIDVNGAPHASYLRHWDLVTPQGFDPFLTTRYKALIEEDTLFETDRLFAFSPFNTRLMDLLAVRYVVASESDPHYRALAASPLFRRVGPAGSYFSIYEYLNAKPSCRWEPEGGARIETLLWTPEKRHFRVRAESAGRLALIEELFPGWHATVDGRPIRIELWQKAFQSAPVASGDHLVTFEYSPASIRIGALVSLCSLAGLIVIARRNRVSKPHQAPAPPSNSPASTSST
jgi:hypothetical protein